MIKKCNHTIKDGYYFIDGENVCSECFYNNAINKNLDFITGKKRPSKGGDAFADETVRNMRHG